MWLCYDSCSTLQVRRLIQDQAELSGSCSVMELILWDDDGTSPTQFFGYFGVLLGVHHPKTNVFVLQDLRCELRQTLDSIR